MDFNNQIEAYLDLTRELKFQEQFIIDKVSNCLKKKDKNLKIVDLGCGDGLLIRSLSSKFPYHAFQGFDLSNQLIEIAKSRGNKNNLSYAVKDCRSIKDYKVDVIIASGILSIFDDWEFILKKWMDILYKDGCIFIFGGFNPFDIDVKIKFRNNFKSDDWQTGLDLISIETLKKFSIKNKINLKNLGEFRVPIEIPKSDNPIRGFTIKDYDGSNLVINGAVQVRRFFLFKLEK